MSEILNNFNKLQYLRYQQHGAVLLVMLVVLVLGAAAMLLNSLNSTTARLARDKVTADALAQAKEALIGYAINSENAGISTTRRPGNFPCPDRDAPGTLGYGDQESSCSSGGGTTIGRLPWKTLGIPELIDGDGEPLWYAISNNFRKSASIINSDTLGTMLVYDQGGVALLTPQGSEAAAIVFSPGRPITGQSRVANQSALCATTNTSIELNRCATNYLDIANGHNNATANGSFITADKSDSFNDRMIIIRTRDFMPTIEKKIAKSLQAILDNYRTVHGYYPYPAPFSSCKDDTTCTSNVSICRGRLPYNALPFNWSGSNVLPFSSGSTWFIDNQWYRVIYYSAGTNRLATPPAGCSTTLNVSGNSTAALLFMPGTPLVNITRSTYPNNNLSWYLEDAENQNMDDIYISPTSNSNDQLYALP